MDQSIDDLSSIFCFENKAIECHGYRLKCQDVCGQSTIRPYWKNYFETLDGVSWVVDSTDQERMVLFIQEFD